MVIQMTPAEQRLYQLIDIKYRRKENAVCDITEASALLEFEQPTVNHTLVMYEAIEWAETQYKISLNDIKYLHSRLFPNGGDFRASSACINGSNVALTAPRNIPVLLLQWCRDVDFLVAKYPTWESLAYLHLEFVTIHPFSDGNGRIARILLNYVAVRCNLPYICIKDRETYLNLLESRNIRGLALFFEQNAMSRE